jgi:hypothetical protein
VEAEMGENALRQLRAFLLILCISLTQCGSHGLKSVNTIKDTGDAHSQGELPISLCSLDGFTLSAAEHIIEEIKQPFVIQKIEGSIVNFDNSTWSRDSRVLFEIRGIAKDGQIRRTYADENGYFVFNGITEGRYCFKATVLGWQSVMGIIIVSKKADPKGKIVFKMRLGV